MLSQAAMIACQAAWSKPGMPDLTTNKGGADMAPHPPHSPRQGEPASFYHGSQICYRWSKLSSRSGPSVANVVRLFEMVRKIGDLDIFALDGVEPVGGYALHVAVNLLVEHLLLLAAGPQAPRVVIDHVGHDEVTGNGSPEFDLQVDQYDPLGRPGALESLENATAGFGHARDLLTRGDARRHNFVRLHLWVMPRIVLDEELDQHRVKAMPLGNLWVSLEIGTGCEAAHHNLERD